MARADNGGRTVVSLVQINGMSLAQHATDQAKFSFLPYSVGLLEAYARRHLANPRDFAFRLPIFQRMPVDAAVAQLDGADVVGFSAYVWNVNLSLAIAARLRQRSPETLIVFGGPQVPDRAEAFLRAHRFIDLACHGEGERVFTAILERSRDHDWSEIPSISYLSADGTFVHQLQADRIDDLSTVPSPYLEGTFDRLMAANADVQWFPLWETNRGCPFRCSFCDWGSAIASRVYRFEMERLREEIDWFARREVEFIYCCDANYGMLGRDVEITEMLVESKRQRGFPWWISVQNAKNATERSFAITRLLSDAGMSSRTGVTISFQSLHPPTLEAIQRDNISIEAFQDLQRRCRREGIETYSDMIVGLPGEDFDAFADGVGRVIQNGQHNRLQFYNCSLLPNAEMADPAYRERYGLRTVPVRMIEAHTPLAAVDEEVFEYLETCVATQALPADDWLKAKAFSWWTEFLHFQRVAQIPFVVLHSLYGVGYRELIEACIRDDPQTWPVLSGLRQLFMDGARRVQAGGTELFPSQQWLEVYWPADQWALIQIVVANRVAHFYVELERALVELLERRRIAYDPVAVHQAVHLNNCLLKVPFKSHDIEIELSHNIWEFYTSVLEGAASTLESGAYRYRIRRSAECWRSCQEWCASVIDRQNVKRGYIYEVAEAVPAGALE